jgi:hypothetical protein
MAGQLETALPGKVVGHLTGIERRLASPSSNGAPAARLRQAQKSQLPDKHAHSSLNESLLRMLVVGKHEFPAKRVLHIPLCQSAEKPAHIPKSQAWRPSLGRMAGPAGMRKGRGKVVEGSPPKGISRAPGGSANGRNSASTGRWGHGSLLRATIGLDGPVIGPPILAEPFHPAATMRWLGVSRRRPEQVNSPARWRRAHRSRTMRTEQTQKQLDDMETG